MLKRTPLYQKHLVLNAKMVPFAGWEMPVSYPAGIIAEHLAVRASAGLFDIGHMGLIKIDGKDALALIQKVATNDAAQLELNQCQYALLCNAKGGAIDDIMVYRLPMTYMIIANASNADKVVAHLKEQAKKFDSINISTYDYYSTIAVQGPKAAMLVEKVLGISLEKLKKNHCVWWKDVVVSRTGYTGEDGVELMVPKTELEKTWDDFIKAGALPCGLGARDTLRLEAGLPLYGHEYDEETSPLEVGYGWAVKLGKGDFIGKEALLKEKEAGLRKKLVGLEIEGRAIPREGNSILDIRNSKLVGKVTSGTFSPTFKKPIALAFLPPQKAVLGNEVQVMIRDLPTPARIVSKSFYKPSA